MSGLPFPIGICYLNGIEREFVSQKEDSLREVISSIHLSIRIGSRSLQPYGKPSTLFVARRSPL